jgi:heme exporter protein D
MMFPWLCLAVALAVMVANVVASQFQRRRGRRIA